MSYIDTLASWFTDHRRTLPQRMAVILVILLAVYTTNDILGFSYYYRMNRKVELLDRLTKIITNEKTDSAGRAEAFSMRNRIAFKEPSYFNLFSFLGRLLGGGPKSANSTATPPIITNTTNIAANVSMRNEFLFFIASSGLFAIVGIILIPMILLSNRRDTIPQRAATAILITLAFAFITFSMYALMDLIPKILKNWAYNYMLNAIFQIGSIALMIILAKRSNKFKTM
ncbi:hypothetical protein [Chitinophaga cymbidii]|uniref:hypothetical protein n=1 Tax=Chitinophaga cymbidii TaxID=1096750 RepID=UPI0011BF0FE5|nr:hypothetical protein [Chitinophaga cymbidii]